MLSLSRFVATTDYVFDGEGNLASETIRATGATTIYTWATGHRLIRVTKPGGGVLSYSYDPEGRRIKTINADGSATVYGYDGMWVAATWNTPTSGGTSVLDRTYVYDPGGTPLQASTPGQPASSRVYPVLDGLGSITSLLDASGAKTNPTAYSVFGEPAPANAGGPVGLDGVYGYTGHAWDNALGQHHARARWYNPGVGRFTGEDPINAINLYNYVGNQPLRFQDPTGRMAVEGVTMANQGARNAAAIGYLQATVWYGVLGGMVTYYETMLRLVTGSGLSPCLALHYASNLGIVTAIGNWLTAVRSLLLVESTAGTLGSVVATTGLILASGLWFYETSKGVRGNGC